MKWNVFVAIRRARLGLTLAALSITLLWASPAKAGTTKINTCGFTITTSGVYTLGTNLGPCAGDGIDIYASNVTLLLNGHTISGATSGNCNDSYGINVLGTSSVPLSRVNVLGPGTISNFYIGVVASYSAGGSVSFTTVTAPLAGCPPVGTSSYGLYMYASSHWTLLGNVVRESGLYSVGIYVQLDASQSPEGMDSDNNVIGNNVNDSIYLQDNNKSNILANTASNNYGGIVVLGGSNNNIDANTTKNNDGAGCSITIGCSGIWLTADSNVPPVYATGNNIAGNTSFNNLPYDMEDDSPCGSNKWEFNHFKTANESCIH